MRHYKHNSRVAQQSCKICILQFNTSQEHINEDLTPSLAWLQCLKPKWKNLPTTYAVSWHLPYGVVFIKKNCHVSSVNLAELGEENTVHIQSLSFQNENDFLLKLVVSSWPEISMNFPRNSLFLWFPKNCLAVRKMCIQSSWLIGPNSQHFPNWNLKMHTFYT